MTKLIWTLAFWKKQAEAIVVTFASVLAGSGIFTGGVPTWHSVLAALISAGVASLYVLAKAIGGSEVLVSLGAKHAAQTQKPPTNQF
jgi:hypothetical protein